MQVRLINDAEEVEKSFIFLFHSLFQFELHSNKCAHRLGKDVVIAISHVYGNRQEPHVFGHQML